MKVGAGPSKRVRVSGTSAEASERKKKLRRRRMAECSGGLRPPVIVVKRWKGEFVLFGEAGCRGGFVYNVRRS